jgi:hypothetical protein
MNLLDINLIEIIWMHTNLTGQSAGMETTLISTHVWYRTLFGEHCDGRGGMWKKW